MPRDERTKEAATPYFQLLSVDFLLSRLSTIDFPLFGPECAGFNSHGFFPRPFCLWFVPSLQAVRRQKRRVHSHLPTPSNGLVSGSRSFCIFFLRPIRVSTSRWTQSKVVNPAT